MLNRETADSAKREHVIQGYNGADMTWIVCADCNADEIIPQDEGFSVGYLAIECYLAAFLRKYFDPKIQMEGHRYVQRGILAPDPYGSNIYTAESMREMLRDIQEALQLIRTDPTDERVEEIVSEWPVPGRSRVERLSAEEINMRQLIALEFYERFCESLENMLRRCKCPWVLIQGP